MVKILLVEDDLQLINMYKRALEIENMDVETAADGEEGLSKAKTTQPDLILLDILMPKMDGMQVLLRLKTSEDTQNIPVIVLTNLTGTRDAQTADYMGAVKFIIKSEYEPKQVVELIKEILRANGHTELTQKITL